MTGWFCPRKGWRSYAAQNSLEALKQGGVEAKFVPLFVLGSFALQDEKERGIFFIKTQQGGKCFLIN